LTGRKYVFTLYGLSAKEIVGDSSTQNFDKNIDNIIHYGSYPEIITSRSFNKKEILLDQITDSNLYKDILGYQNIRNPLILRQLLKALALQIGNEVSTQELSSNIGIDKNTVEKYIDLLEKSFIVFRLGAFSRHKRQEISKNKKVYFYDLGIRNALINDFREFGVRSDFGSLWENFIILEMLKTNSNNNDKAELSFWRTYKGAEIDLVAVTSKEIIGYEIKSNNKAPQKPLNWTHGDYKIINRDNYLKYIVRK
jgi:hypothetical protein